MSVKLIKSSRSEFHCTLISAPLTTSLSARPNLFADYFLEQSPAAFLHIPPGRVEIVGVPRIGHLSGTVGKVHQQVHFVGKVAAADPVHIPQVGMIHSNQEIVFLVVAIQELPGSLAGTVDAMLGQLAASWRIHRIADLLGAGGC